MKTYKYSILKGSKDPMSTKILMTGLENELTIGEILETIKFNERSLKEVETNLKLKQAILDNVIEHHPEVKKLSEELLKACYVYREVLTYIEAYNEKIKDINKAQKEMQVQLKEIEKQTGLCQPK